MRLVMEVLIMKIESIPTLNTVYENNYQNKRELKDIFKKVNNIFAKANSKQINDRIGQLSWQTFVRDAWILKYKVPLTLIQRTSVEDSTGDQNTTDLNINNSNTDNISVHTIIDSNIQQDNNSYKFNLWIIILQQ